MSSILIRRSVFRGESKTYHDLEIDTSKVTIGADADNTVNLRGEGVEHWHAVIVVARDGGAKIRSVGKHKVTVNGEPVSNSALVAGDEVSLGKNVIVVLPTPPGFTLALQVDATESAQEQHLESNYRTDILQTGVGKRRPAWIFGLLVLTFFLLVPLVSSQFFKMEDTSIPNVFTDAIWAAGEIHPAHRLATGGDCSACHNKPFSRVSEESCTACHENISDHAAPHQMAERDLSEQRCGGCHREHNSADLLATQSGSDCESCHAVTNLALDHPPFVDYPNPERPQIIFDHSSHENKHFQGTKRTFECGSCHALDPAGQHEIIASFETMCVDCHGEAGGEVPSKVFHHGDQIVSADPVSVFTLPRLDLKSLAKTTGLGDWPEGTKGASRDGLTRLGITPFTELLLSTDPQTAAALSRLRLGKVKLSSLKKADAESIADVLTVIWGVKRLLVDLALDAEQAVAGRLNPILEASLSDRELAALTGQIQTEFVQNAVASWFYDETGRALVEDAKDGPKALTDYLVDTKSSKPPTVANDLPGAPWVRTGLWQEVKYSMQYLPPGHTDSFIKAWLDLSMKLQQSASQTTGIEYGVREAANALFEELADAKAKPGKAKGAGRCSKCHSQITDDEGMRSLAWNSLRANPLDQDFTRYRHADHVGPDKQEVCIDCHIRAEDSDVLSAYAEDAELGKYASNFEPLAIETCTTCHAPQDQASDECLTCHYYHVSPVVGFSAEKLEVFEAADAPP